MNEIPEQLAVTATPASRTRQKMLISWKGFRKQQDNYFRAQGT